MSEITDDERARAAPVLAAAMDYADEVAADAAGAGNRFPEEALAAVEREAVVLWYEAQRAAYTDGGVDTLQFLIRRLAERLKRQGWDDEAERYYRGVLSHGGQLDRTRAEAEARLRELAEEAE